MAYGDRSPGFEAEIIHWAQNPYHIRVPALIAIAFAWAAVVYFSGLPDWLVLFAIIPYLLAVIATYYELRRKDRSGWWTLLMIASFNFGPSWVGMSIGAMINLVPLVIALRSAEPAAAD